MLPWARQRIESPKRDLRFRCEPLKLRNYIRPEISMLLPAQSMKVVGWRGQVHDLTQTSQTIRRRRLRYFSLRALRPASWPAALGVYQSRLRNLEYHPGAMLLLEVL